MTATAQLIKQGRGQAIRLPRGFHFPGKAVTLRRTPRGVLIISSAEPDGKMRAAAAAYEAFLDSHPEERAGLEVWETAPLVDDIEPSHP